MPYKRLKHEKGFPHSCDHQRRKASDRRSASVESEIGEWLAAKPALPE
jgi:hypothetical protein